MTDSGAERAARRIVRELVESVTDETFENHVDHVAVIIQEETATQYAQGQLDEFLRVQKGRPVDPVFWDMHEERRLRAALPPAPGDRGTK